MHPKIIFIDDSGNILLTHLFVICFIVFESEAEAAKTADIIEKLRIRKFGQTTAEFHFNNASQATKREFFRAVSGSVFRIKYYAHGRDHSGTSMTHLKRAFYMHAADIDSARIYMDGRVSKMHKRKIVTELYASIRNLDAKPLSLKFVNSKTHVLIQLADMCAGCIRRKLERGTLDDERLFGQIKRFMH